MPSTVPFWTVDLEDDKETLKWLTENYDGLINQAETRTHTQQRNLAAYRGVQMAAQDIRTREVLTRSNVQPTKNPTPINNVLFDVIEQHVSRVTKFRPNIATVPANNEHRDKMVSKIVDDIIHAIWYREDIDEISQNMTRTARIMAESYLMITFDKDKGKEHPSSKKVGLDADGNRKRVPLTDESGKTINSIDGKPLFIDKPVRIGDICYDVILPWDIFLQRQSKYKDVEWAFYRKVRDVEDIRADYPDKANQIKSNKQGTYFDIDLLTERHIGNQVEEMHLWHRSTTNLHGGRHIVFTRDCVLVNEDNPYDHKDLPWIRRIDVPSPGKLNGSSTTEVVRPLQNLMNNLIGMIIRNQSLMAHPKWMVPRGSVKFESLGNDATVVSYQGPVKPELTKASPTPAEVFNFTEYIEQKIGQLGGVHAVSRGDPPPGIKAGVALQFLDEQENERANTSISQHNQMLRQIALMTASVAGQYFDDSDERLKDLLGPQKAANIDFFKAADLSTIFDIRMETSSALPRQKAARLQSVLDLREAFPGRVTEDQALNMLEFGTPDKFFDIATKALQVAEGENEAILQEKKTEPPEIWEDQVVHYRTHMMVLNDRAYKDAPPKVFKNLKDHIMGHEFLIIESAKKDPRIVAVIQAEFPQFPIFYDGFIPPQVPPANLGAGAPPPQGGPPPQEEAPAPAQQQTTELPPEGIV
jgi:hypothetical protein